MRPGIERQVARILLGLDTATCSAACVADAVRLAQQLQVALTGIFVEDDDLLRSARLPFATETPLGGGEERALDTGGLERALRARARGLEADLARLASAARVQWAFRTVRGRRVPALLAETQPSDLLFLSRTPRGPVEEAMLQEAHTLVVAFDGSDAALRAVALVAELVGQDGRDVVLLDAADASAPVSVTEARDWLRAGVRQVTVRPLAQVGRDDFLAGLRGLKPLLLLLPASSPLFTAPALIDDLRRVVPAPLVLVR